VAIEIRFIGALGSMSSILHRRQLRKRRTLDIPKLESFKNSVASANSCSSNDSSTLTRMKPFSPIDES
jgi:hypothetical protein